VLGGGVQQVSAHAALEASSPSANSVLEVGPTSIVLDFDESIETALTSIVLYGTDGEPVALAAPEAGDDESVVQAAVPDGAALDDGVYAIIWRVTSADGHVVDGAFSFQVGTASAGSGQDLIDQVRNGDKADPAVRWWYGIARFLSLIGAITLIGAGWWLLRGPAEVLRRRRTRWTAVASWLSLLAGSLAAFSLFAAEAVAGSVSDALSTDRWGDVATTQTGRMILLRVAFAGVLGLLLALRRYRNVGWWQGAAAGATVATLVTFPASGHPNAQDPAALWIGIDLVHLASITVWIGGLLALCLATATTLSQPAGERMVRRFSLAASICVPLIVATGVAQTLRLAGGLDDVTATDWGRLLLVKVTVIAVLLAIAGVSRWLLHHDGAASVRRTVVAEFVIGVVVVGIAAGMVGLPPVPAVVAQPFETQLTSAGLIATISLSPGSVGGNEVHITITPPGGSITPVVGVTARVSLPAQNVPFAPVTVVEEGPNHFSGSVTLPRSGDWTFEVVVQVTDADSALMKTTVPIP
jgi:copper transport protein